MAHSDLTDDAIIRRKLCLQKWALSGAKLAPEELSRASQEISYIDEIIRLRAENKAMREQIE